MKDDTNREVEKGTKGEKRERNGVYPLSVHRTSLGRFATSEREGIDDFVAQIARRHQLLSR